MTNPRRSKIGWTDFSGGDLNFVLRGSHPGECEQDVGCANCYALAIQQRFGHGPKFTTCYPEKLARLKTARFEENGVPFRRGLGSRPMAFPVDMGDLFHPRVPDEFIFAAFQVMAARINVDWQVLTKRVDRMLAFSQRLAKVSDGLVLFRTVKIRREARYWPDNIWAMVSVSNQVLADERIPKLLQIPAAVRGVSVEPQLSAIDFTRIRVSSMEILNGLTGESRVPHSEPPEYFGLNLLICGAESGQHCRPFDVDWARSLRDQCQDAGVPFFYKQGSHRFPGRNRLLDGKEHNEFPRV